MEAQAFIESDINKLMDTAVPFIPSNSVIYNLINDIREWHAKESDWRKTREQIAGTYGYDKYGGNCHMVPNHALIIHALLHGEDDFQKTLMIVNTCGWDTDCNSGNVGCLMGIKNGLAGLETGADFRGPVADRLYLPTADGGRAITDAVTETYHVVNIGRALAGKPPVAPKDGARFHFELPGSVQGFVPEDSIESKGTLTLRNVAGHSQTGQRSLAFDYRGVAAGRPARVATATFTPFEAIDMPTYELLASPTLYPGQTVHARVAADTQNKKPVNCRLFHRMYGREDELVRVYGPDMKLLPGSDVDLKWFIESTGGAPIAEIGLEISSISRADGTVYLDYLTWDGEPDVTFTRPVEGGTMWQRAWVDGLDELEWRWLWPESFRLVQNEGRGMLIQGTREWRDYCVSADITPHLVTAAGIAARVQGMRRYYALMLHTNGVVCLVKALDGDTVLAETNFPWTFGVTYNLRLEVVGTQLRAWINDEQIFAVKDPDRALTGGGVALVCEEGRTATEVVKVEPAGKI
jgi:hypothetical protein